MERILYQFPFSHYCEKARWVLDFKGVPYRIHNQFPGIHARTNRRLTGRTSVPLLIEQGQGIAISGSHEIALHLEARALGPSLLPKSATVRVELDHFIRHFDDVVGPAVRRYGYSFILARPALFRDVFFDEYRGVAKLAGRWLARPLTLVIGNMYRVNATAEVGKLPDLVRSAADRVEARLGGAARTARFLFGDELSLADITVASLLGPAIGPAGSPWAMDFDIPQLGKLREELRARPVGRYVAELYAQRPASTASPY